MSWEQLKDKEESLMKCSLCNANALISNRTGQPYCPNFRSHKEEGDTRNSIVLDEMNQYDRNFFEDMVEDGEAEHIKEHRQKKEDK